MAFSTNVFQQATGVPVCIAGDCSFLYPEKRPDPNDRDFRARVSELIKAPLTLVGWFIQILLAFLAFLVCLLAVHTSDASLLLLLAFPVGFWLAVRWRIRSVRRLWKGYADLLERPGSYDVQVGQVREVVFGSSTSVFSPVQIVWNLETSQGRIEGTSPMIVGHLVAHHAAGAAVWIALDRDRSRGLFLGFAGPAPAAREIAAAGWSAMQGQPKTDRWDIQGLGLAERKNMDNDRN